MVTRQVARDAAQAIDHALQYVNSGLQFFLAAGDAKLPAVEGGQGALLHP